jgi:hypothetical protein
VSIFKNRPPAAVEIDQFNDRFGFRDFFSKCPRPDCALKARTAVSSASAMGGAWFCGKFGDWNVVGTLAGEFGVCDLDCAGCTAGASRVDLCCDFEAFATLRLLDLDFVTLSSPNAASTARFRVELFPLDIFQ